MSLVKSSQKNTKCHKTQYKKAPVDQMPCQPTNYQISGPLPIPLLFHQHNMNRTVWTEHTHIDWILWNSEVLSISGNTLSVQMITFRVCLTMNFYYHVEEKTRANVSFIHFFLTKVLFGDVLCFGSCYVYVLIRQVSNKTTPKVSLLSDYLRRTWHICGLEGQGC